MAAEQEIGERFDNVIDKGQKLLTHQSAQGGGPRDRVDNQRCLEWQSQSLTLLQTVFGSDHTFAKNFETSTANQGIVQSLSSAVSRGQGVLKAAQEDLTRGWAWSFREMLHAEIFDDLLDVAEQLLKSGYVDAAAVTAGGALEVHLRELSKKHGVPIGKVNAMNEELGKQKNVYTQPEWRSVQSWYDLRNDAAHQDPGPRTVPQVGLMIDGVRNFIIQHPA